MAAKKNEADIQPLQVHFDFYLIVKNPFGGYSIGQMISEDALIQAVIDNGDLPNCCKISRSN
jgi:hypothetical protein